MDFLPIVEQTIQEIMEEIIEVVNGKGFMALASIITVLGGISLFTGIVNKLLFI